MQCQEGAIERVLMILKVKIENHVSNGLLESGISKEPKLKERLQTTAPASKLVRLLNTPAQQMVRVLKAHEEKSAS